MMMRFKLLKNNIQNISSALLGWVVAIAATTVYLLTMEPTVSFWDCGEFIATSYGLQVGHPPGAPLYQLLAHCLMLLAGDNASMLAWWSNALSALAGGLTAMLLFHTIRMLLAQLPSGPTADAKSRPPALSTGACMFCALIGTACYVFCDTAWFSATESEVYSLSMLFSSATVWAMLRWATTDDPQRKPRWLLLVAFLLGLSVCVHLLTLLTIPVLLVVFFFNRAGRQQEPNSGRPSLIGTLRFSSLCALFFLIGLSPYLIIPIRAAAGTPINMGAPSDCANFKAYITREQYEHAPLIYGRCFNSPIVAYENGKPVYAKEMDMFFPRMWKQHPHAEQYYCDWSGRHGKMVRIGGSDYYKPSFGDNLVIFGGYQLGYMYLRYLMWNFSGRYNDRQGFGNLQKGQFITGIPPIDRLYVGTGRDLPDSMPSKGHNRYFMLPLILGLVGLFAQARRCKQGFWTVMSLFLMGGPLLAVYLNHPMYEPRERDYAYILSFYAFAIWIGVGAARILIIQFKKIEKKWSKAIIQTSKYTVLIAIPLLMACQNWDDHDRSHRYTARDSAAILLDSCSEGAILFTLGDNDTFPLWYLQQVEGYRTDVQVVNISLLGSDEYSQSTKEQLLRKGLDAFPENGWLNSGPYRRMLSIINNCNGSDIFFSHYATDDTRVGFAGRMRLSGMAYRLADSISTDSVDLKRTYDLMTKKFSWQNIDKVYIDEVSHKFLLQYWHDVLLTASNLTAQGQPKEANWLLNFTVLQIPPQTMHDPMLTFEVSKAFSDCGATEKAIVYRHECQRAVREQLDYYGSMSPSMLHLIPYTLEPLQSLNGQLK